MCHAHIQRDLCIRKNKVIDLFELFGNNMHLQRILLTKITTIIYLGNSKVKCVESELKKL